ncbi:MAG: hypothetical protein ABIH25_04055 [Candidatus Woesearchaeota archaeon]
MKYVKQGLAVLGYSSMTLFGAFVPGYGSSLLLRAVVGADPNLNEALELDGIILGVRAGLAILSQMPGLRNIPVLNKAYNLLLPEIFGAIAGVGAFATLKNYKDDHSNIFTNLPNHWNNKKTNGLENKVAEEKEEN